MTPVSTGRTGFGTKGRRRIIGKCASLVLVACTGDILAGDILTGDILTGDVLGDGLAECVDEALVES